MALSFPGASQRSSTTPTSTTRIRCTAPPFPRRPPSARQWWQCGTALGGATSPRCTWSRGRSPSATGAPPLFTRNTPRTLTAPRSTTMPQAPAAGSSPRCSWSPARIRVHASSTQRTCRPQTGAGPRGERTRVSEDEELGKGKHMENLKTPRNVHVNSP